MQSPARSCLAEEESVLPTVEALLAGTLALMTGCAQEGGDRRMRELMASKVVGNLLRLGEHPDLSPAMRCMLTRLSTSWSGAGTQRAAWIAAPAALL